MFQVSVLSQQVAELEGQLDKAHRDKSSLTNQLEDFIQKLTSQEQDNTKVHCVDSERRPLSQYQGCIIYCFSVDIAICKCTNSCFIFLFYYNTIDNAEYKNVSISVFSICNPSQHVLDVLVLINIIPEKTKSVLASGEYNYNTAMNN